MKAFVAIAILILSSQTSRANPSLDCRAEASKVALAFGQLQSITYERGTVDTSMQIDLASPTQEVRVSLAAFRQTAHGTREVFSSRIYSATGNLLSSQIVTFRRLANEQTRQSFCILEGIESLD